MSRYQLLGLADIEFRLQTPMSEMSLQYCIGRYFLSKVRSNIFRKLKITFQTVTYSILICQFFSVQTFFFIYFEITLHTELFTTQWYIKSKSQKRPFPSIKNQDSSNRNKICKILTHRGMLCSCVLNRDIEKLGVSIVNSP